MISHSRLGRRLNLSDAVFLGLGSMIGAGIFAAAGPAASVAGAGLLFAVLLAGLIALFNALTIAQLSRLYPESGGVYAYGRHRLNRRWGFLAGWGFVLGKTASCAAMALTFAAYAAPGFEKPLAIFAVALLAVVNSIGVRKTAFVTKLLVGIVITTLLIAVTAAMTSGNVNIERVFATENYGNITGILQASGLLFFAFAGYARVATLGEEVLEPQRTIPRAILIALGITISLYFVVMTTLVLTLDLPLLQKSTSPITDAIASGDHNFIVPIVRIAASAAAISVLLSLMAGMSRTLFAMSANSEMPRFLSVVHKKFATPYRADALVGIGVMLTVLVSDLKSAIGFSSFAILIYYAIANVSVLTLKDEERLWPRWLGLVGLALCLAIAFSLPWSSIFAGVAFFALGALIFQWIDRPRKRGRPQSP